MEIRNLRLSTGLSQSQFASKFNIPVGTISHWEQGVRNPPQYVIFMIERILELEKLNNN